jgi:hypothetical protein
VRERLRVQKATANQNQDVSASSVPAVLAAAVAVSASECPASMHDALRRRRKVGEQTLREVEVRTGTSGALLRVSTTSHMTGRGTNLVDDARARVLPVRPERDVLPAVRAIREHRRRERDDELVRPVFPSARAPAHPRQPTR